MTLPAELAPLRDRVVEVIRSNGPAGEVPSLLLDIFRFQYAHNPVYRAYCDRSGHTPATVDDWSSIPAVPAAAFKVAPLVCGDPGEAAAVYRTSGTTRGRDRRGTHYVLDLAPYHAALDHGFRRHLLPEGGPLRMISLVPDAAQIPDSSLGHMAARVMERHGDGAGGSFAGPGSVDVAGSSAHLERAEKDGTPVCILTTAFALVHLLDHLSDRGKRLRLPEGSRMMETGGFKGRTREVSRAELYRETGDRLGIHAQWIVNEYGMTELGSQLYDAEAGRGEPLPDRRHRAPPWLLLQARDPDSLRPLPAGATGVLRFWDPVNVGSVAVVQTEDLGIVEEDGSVRLLGRTSGAEPRGCSLAMEEVERAVAEGAAERPV